MKPFSVHLSPTAQRQYLALIDYLKVEWSDRVKEEFQKRFDKKVNQVALHPRSCPESAAVSGVFKAVVEKHTSFFYRINSQEIEILTIIDNCQDPQEVSKLLGD